MSNPVRLNIAIDGFAACGKSTLARDLAKALSFTHLDTGLMYRAVCLYFLRCEVDLETFRSNIDQYMQSIRLDVQLLNGSNTILLNDENVTPLLRTPEIDAVVSDIAAIRTVRLHLVHTQQQIAASGHTILDGRDIGTHVLPTAGLKIFLTAHIDTRASRRQKDMQHSGIEKDLEWIKKELEKRDNKDSNRKESPLRQAPDAVVIDNTNLTKEEQLKIICTLAQCRM